MKKTTFFFLSVLLLLPLLTLAGCSKGSGEARDKVDEALRGIGAARPLLEDLLDLDGRFDSLGTRFANVEDTIAEGKSMAEVALSELDELEGYYSRARDLLREVVEMEEAGKYGEYAVLALDAVEKELEALKVNRDLLNAVWDMLDVLPRAEKEEQLSYYVEEIDRLTREVSDLMGEASAAAAEGDRFREAHGL